MYVVLATFGMVEQLITYIVNVTINVIHLLHVNLYFIHVVYIRVFSPIRERADNLSLMKKTLFLHSFYEITK